MKMARRKYKEYDDYLKIKEFGKNLKAKYQKKNI